MRNRIWLIVAMICMAVLLSGCDLIMQPEPTPSPTLEPIPTVELTEAPTPTPEPTPAITPVPQVAVADYTYSSFSNKSLGVKFAHPSHWENVPGKSTVSFVEPTEEGAIPSRIAVSASKLSKSPNAKKLKSEMSRFMNAIKKDYDAFKTGKLSSKAKMLKVTGVSQTYTATKEDGTSIRGKVVIVYNKAKKKLYAYHFYTAGDRYPDMAPVISHVQSSLKVLS